MYSKSRSGPCSHADFFIFSSPVWYVRLHECENLLLPAVHNSKDTLVFRLTEPILWYSPVSQLTVQSLTPLYFNNGRPIIHSRAPLAHLRRDFVLQLVSNVRTLSYGRVPLPNESLFELVDCRHHPAEWNLWARLCTSP